MGNKTSMTIEIPVTPFKDRVISPNQKPTWTKGEFVRAIENVATKGVGTAEGPLVDDSYHVNQLANDNFSEFEEETTIGLTGINAEVMRPHGCGISAVYMALEAIGKDGFRSKFKTVGEFAIAVLGFHRNDYVEGGIRNVGTPVFNLSSGWYHDALVYAAETYGGVVGFRVEGVDDLTKVGVEFQTLAKDHQSVMSVISVRNSYWRLKTEKSSVSTHMVVVNGYKFSEDGDLVGMRVTDSYVSDHAKINEWIDVDDRIKQAFTGKAMFFYR